MTHYAAGGYLKYDTQLTTAIRYYNLLNVSSYDTKCKQWRTQGGYKGIYTPPPKKKLPCIVPQGDIFLTDIVGYDRLKLHLKIYTPKLKSWVRY